MPAGQNILFFFGGRTGEGGARDVAWETRGGRQHGKVREPLRYSDHTVQLGESQLGQCYLLTVPV